MKKGSFSFSLIDFLAYVFPGTIMALGLFTLALLIPVSKLETIEMKFTWGSGLIGVAVVYFLGMLSSNIFLLLGFEKRKFTESEDIENPLTNPLLADFRDEIRESFEKHFGVQDTWSKNHYYLIRSVVRELAPQSAEYANRQNSLRHMRKNIILPIWLWGLVGLITGIRMLWCDAIQRNLILGPLLIILSLVLTLLITHALLEGVKRNREFEVRDYCLAFLHSEKLGKLERQQNQTTSQG